jgi:putative acyl-CoA dehydrogenase
VLGSTSLMRRALSEAAWHAAHRSAFGSLLVDKPLMQNVLADLAVEAEAATALAMRLAAAVDGLDKLDHREAAHESALRRIALPLAKFWVCKRTPFMVAEALECLGGNGYVEESGLPLLYREAPLNSVWEGSGNVNALDVLRALGREPEVLDAWITEVGHARGGDVRLDRAIDDTLALLGESMTDAAALEVSARRLAGRMALCLQGSLLVRFAPPEVADVFCASRLGTTYDGVFGALDGGDLRAIVDRAMPTV